MIWRRSGSATCCRPGLPAPHSWSSRPTPTRKRTVRKMALNEAQLDQQKAVLASLDVQQNQLQRRCRGPGAGDAGAEQPWLYAHRLAGRRAGRPATGAAWAVRQCRHADHYRRAAAEYLGDRQLQGDADDQCPDGAARAGHGRCVPGSAAARPCRQLVARHRQHLRPAAAGQCDRQLHQGRAACTGEDRSGRGPGARHAGTAGPVGRGNDRHRRPRQAQAAEDARRR